MKATETFVLFHPAAFAPGLIVPTIPGALVSLTITENVADALLPDTSRAVQVTVVCPRANVPPDTGVHVTAGEGSMLSVAVGSAYWTTAPAADVASFTRSGDGLTSGAVVSGAGA